MNDKNEIINELNELGWLYSSKIEAPYSESDDYFNSFNRNMLEMLKMEDFLADLSRNMPMDVPVGYFDTFNAKIISKVQENEPMHMIRTRPKVYTWAMAASITLILLIGNFIFQGSKNLSIENQLSQFDQKELDQYINEHAYDFNDYVLDGNQKETSNLENKILQETQGLSESELMEFAL